MKLEKWTIEVLKNFSNINQSIYVPGGTDNITTMSNARNMIGDAVINQVFPVDIAIYDLNAFLSALSLFSDPELTFEEKYIQVREDGQRKGGIKVHFCNKDLILYPKKKYTRPDEDFVEFVLKDGDINKLVKASSILKTQDISFTGNSGGIMVSATSRQNSSSDSFDVVVGEESPYDFQFYMKVENLRLLAGDYKVSISKNGLGVFVHDNGNVKYLVSLEFGV